ncbi:hypothetical protein [Flavobacterium sp. A45]|uniref:hypothetical protein n=1 Tax=Flavobacterium sp. A45 TaxID=1945862 RepID=UPI00098683F2|nr:hypothetical protein [Flavobacterium sp. A45]OOG77777.1 hypothetical protein B0E44_01925 [Flavobacterium sp. A45]
MGTKKTVLVIGIDPSLIDFTTPEFAAMPGLTAEKVEMGIKNSITQLNEIGYDAHLCWTDFGATAIDVIKKQLQEKHFDCVLIGAGIRKPESTFLFFEKAINVILEFSPKSKICFNTNPMDTVAAVQRWISN